MHRFWLIASSITQKCCQIQSRKTLICKHLDISKFWNLKLTVITLVEHMIQTGLHCSFTMPLSFIGRNYWLCKKTKKMVYSIFSIVHIYCRWYHPDGRFHRWEAIWLLFGSYSRWRHHLHSAQDDCQENPPHSDRAHCLWSCGARRQAKELHDIQEWKMENFTLSEREERR